MMESDDEDFPPGSKHTIHGQKRQKHAKSQSNGTREEAFPTSSRDGKAFRFLQEQREQLPIARGGIITNLHNIDNVLSSALPFIRARVTRARYCIERRNHCSW